MKIIVRIQKYFEYCGGFGYLNKPMYYNDLAQSRSINTLLQARLDTMLLNAHIKAMRALMHQMGIVPEDEMTPIGRAIKLVQQGIATTLQPVFFVARKAQGLMRPFIRAGVAMARFGWMLGRPIAQLTAAILSYFYSFRKEEEEFEEEMEIRSKSDFHLSDFYTRREVEAGSGAGGGGGQTR